MTVPPTAVGFEIVTPVGKVVDLGTQFSLRVDQEQTRVDVIKGSVVFEQMNRPSQVLNEQMALQGKRDGISQSVHFDPLRFMGPLRFDEKLSRFLRERKDKEEIKRMKLDLDPAILVRYDFNQSKIQAVPNSARGTSALDRNALIKGLTLDQGPLDGMNSYHFRRKKDQIALSFPNPYHALTLFMYVRIDHLKSGNMILFSTETEDPTARSFVFQILGNGSLHLRIRKENKMGSDEYTSTQAFQHQDLGTWCAFAVVLDPARKKISFYKEGELLSEADWTVPTLLGMDSAVFGSLLQGSARG